MNKIKLPIELESGFHTNNVTNPKQVFLLLHGYMLDGQFMYDVFKQYLPSDALIIAPNGPFLIPHKKKDKFIPRYSWYFYDSQIKHFYIDFEPAAKMLSQMLDKLAPKVPTTIIGYSQGGYIAPKVAEYSENITKVIGLACTFRNERFKERNIDYHQIHSHEDGIVDLSESVKEFNRLQNPGKYIELRDIGHKLGPAYFEALRQLI